MTKEDWYEEMKADAYNEAKQEAMEEYKMREDLDHAYEKLGINDIYQAITDLANKLADYEHDISIQDIIDRLEEI